MSLAERGAGQGGARSNGAKIALALVAGAGVFAGIVTLVPQREGAVVTDGAQDVAEEPVADVAADAAATGESVPAEPVAEVPDATAEAAAAPEAPAMAAPQVDTLRVEPDGMTVVAGRAAAGATVAVVIGGEVLAEVVADGTGAFVAMLDLPPSDQPRALAVVADPAGAAVESEGTFLVAPTVPAEVEVAALTADEAVPAADGAVVTGEAETGVAEAPEATAEPVAEDTAMAEVAPEEGAGTETAGADDGAEAVTEAADTAGAQGDEESVTADVAPAGEGDADSVTAETETVDVAEAQPDATAEVAAAEPLAEAVVEEPTEAGEPAATTEGVPDAGAETSEALAEAGTQDQTDGTDADVTVTADAVPATAEDAGPEAGEDDTAVVAEAATPGVAGEAAVDAGEAATPGVTEEAAAVVAEAATPGAAADDEAAMAEAETLGVAEEVSADATVAETPGVAAEVAAEATEAVAAEAEPVTAEAETPEAAPEPEVVVAAAEAPGVTAEAEVAETPGASAEAPEVVPVVADEAPGLVAPVAGEVAAPPVLVSDAEGVRVLQPSLAPGAGPEVLETVAVDAIAYDAEGAVDLSGRAAGGGTVRIYIDNSPIADVPVDADGQWKADLTALDPGVYTLRVDQLDATGAVTSRMETPFLREDRAEIAAVMAEETSAEGFEVAVQTVQPGNTLWAIARDRYGDGVLYVQVFEANRDRIRNPDLIYPGQIFVLPEEIGAP